jgi:RNase P subunit p30
LSSLLDRFRATNVTTIALTHTVYGTPNLSRDAVEQVFPSDWIQELTERRRRTNGTSGGSQTPLRILTRLHAVVESASDLRHFQQQPQQSTGAETRGEGGMVALLRGYDVVSVAPRNDAAFQAACEVARESALFEIVTLEYYTAGAAIGNRAVLPFRVRAGQVRCAIRNGRLLEVPYAPALLNHREAPSYRRAFVQTLHELRSASLGHKLRVVLSSGPRQTARLNSSVSDGRGKDDGLDDAGPLALRMPGDMVNLLTTVLRWGHADAAPCVAANPHYAVETAARIRKFGPNMADVVRSVRVEAAGISASKTLPVPKKSRKEPPHATNGLDDGPDGTKGDDDEEGTVVCLDGFISLS